MLAETPEGKAADEVRALCSGPASNEKIMRKRLSLLTEITDSLVRQVAVSESLHEKAMPKPPIYIQLLSRSRSIKSVQRGKGKKFNTLV